MRFASLSARRRFMQPLDYTARIPPEIVLHIFNNACLDEFRRFMLVSRRWRELARTHPTFWSAPQLDGTSPSDVAFFLSRISAGAGKPVSLELHMVEPDMLLETTVLPAIAPQLDSYISLSLHVHISHAPAVFELLRRPIPLLQSLGIFFESSTDSGPSSIVSLPDDILPSGCQPSEIKTVFLQNVDIHRVPTALQTARNVVYCQKSRSASTNLQAVAAAFPHVRDLTLSGRGLPDDLVYSNWPNRWEYLKSLTFSVGRHRLQKFLSAVPLPNVLHLTADHTRRRALSILLTHLHGVLYMAFKDVDARDFVLHLTSIVSGQTRSLRERRSTWEASDAPPHDVLRMDAVLSRVVSLTIPVTMWDFLVPRMAPFPKLETLTILLFPNAGHSLLLHSPQNSPATAVLVCPQLQLLVFDGADGSPTVPLEDVKRIILDRLRAPIPINLALRCSWRGYASDMKPEVGTVFDLFDRVDHYPKTPWHGHMHGEKN